MEPQPRQSDSWEAYYFGTWLEPGHYLWGRDMRRLRYGEARGPWGWVDGKLVPRGGEDGEALLHHKDGWTCVAFYNRAWDGRPSCNSAFLFDQTLTFAQALQAARVFFPQVIAKLPFEIVEADRAAA